MRINLTVNVKCQQDRWSGIVTCSTRRSLSGARETALTSRLTRHTRGELRTRNKKYRLHGFRLTNKAEKERQNQVTALPVTRDRNRWRPQLQRVIMGAVGTPLTQVTRQVPDQIVAWTGPRSMAPARTTRARCPAGSAGCPVGYPYRITGGRCVTSVTVHTARGGGGRVGKPRLQGGEPGLADRLFPARRPCAGSRRACRRTGLAGPAHSPWCVALTGSLFCSDW